MLAGQEHGPAIPLAESGRPHVCVARQLLGLGANSVSAWDQVRSVVLTGIIGGKGSRHTAVSVYDRGRCSDDYTAGLVCNRSENPSIAAL